MRHKEITGTMKRAHSLGAETRPANSVGVTAPGRKGMHKGTARKARLQQTGGSAVHASNYPPLSSSESLAPLSGGMLHHLPEPSSLAVHAAGGPPLKMAAERPNRMPASPVKMSKVPVVGKGQHPGMEHESDSIAKTADVYSAHNNPTPVPTPLPFNQTLAGEKAALKDLDLLPDAKRTKGY